MKKSQQNIGEDLRAAYVALVASCAMTAYLSVQVVTGLVPPVI